MKIIPKINNLIPPLEKILIERGISPKYPLDFLPEFNKKIWGMRVGLTTICGRTSNAKTALVNAIAWNYAQQGLPVVNFSLELPNTVTLERLFCMSQRVDNFKLLCGGLKNELDIQRKWTDFKATIPTNLYLAEGIGFDFKELNNAIELFNPSPKVIIVDYVQSIRTAFEERIELNEYIRKFRELAYKRDFIGILVSQANRMATNNENKRPSLENMKGTSVLEEHSDSVILVHWDYFYTKDPLTKNNYEIILAKNNAGRTGMHEVKFIPEYYLFQELDAPVITGEEQKIMDVFKGSVEK